MFFFIRSHHFVVRREKRFLFSLLKQEKICKLSQEPSYNKPFPSTNKPLEHVKVLLIKGTIRVQPIGYLLENYFAKARNLNVLLNGEILEILE